MTDVPDEITLPADTVAAVMANPALMAEMEQAAEQGTAELIAWLDAHGLRWRPGGSDPMAAFADAAAHGGLEFEGPIFEELGWTGEAPVEPYTPNRAARRKATRKARKASRRR